MGHSGVSKEGRSQGLRGKEWGGGGSQGSIDGESHTAPRTHTVIVLHELDNPVQGVVQGLPAGMGHSWSGDPGGGVLPGRPKSGTGAHLHRTLKFLPRATCRRDRLLPMASTRVTMSEPKPGGGWGHAWATLRECGWRGTWADGCPGGLTVIRQVQGAHGAGVAHQVLDHLSARRAQLQREGGARSGHGPQVGSPP